MNKTRPCIFLQSSWCFLTLARSQSKESWDRKMSSPNLKDSLNLQKFTKSAKVHEICKSSPDLWLFAHLHQSHVDLNKSHWSLISVHPCFASELLLTVGHCFRCKWKVASKWSLLSIQLIIAFNDFLYSMHPCSRSKRQLRVVVQEQLACRANQLHLRHASLHKHRAARYQRVISSSQHDTHDQPSRPK